MLAGMDDSHLSLTNGGQGGAGAGLGRTRPSKKPKDKAAKKAASALGGMHLASGVRKEVELLGAEKDDDPGSDTEPAV